MSLAKLEEMRGHQYAESAAPNSVVARLCKIPAYVVLFRVALGGATLLMATTISKALTYFEYTLAASDSPFDRCIRGNRATLTIQQVQGLTDFLQSVCAKYHTGPMLSDYQLHVLSTADNTQNTTSDTDAKDTYAFRTPSLRNVVLTTPYMQGGTLGTPANVIDFYDNDRNTANPYVSTGQRDAQFLGRVVNKQAIVTFLNSLTASSYDHTVPAAVPSGLPVGGSIK